MYEYYKWLAQRLEILLRKFDDEMSVSEHDDCWEFLGAGEYGITLETLSSIIVENQISIDMDTYNRMMELNDRMHLDLRESEMLKSLVRD